LNRREDDKKPYGVLNEVAGSSPARPTIYCFKNSLAVDIDASGKVFNYQVRLGHFFGSHTCLYSTFLLIRERAMNQAFQPVFLNY